MKYVLGVLYSFFLAIIPKFAYAHVGYVVDSGLFPSHSGSDTSFLISVFSEPKNSIIILATLMIVLLLSDAYVHSRNARATAKAILDRAQNYRVFLPFIARLSVGIALLGSGTAGVLISPIADATPFLATLEIYLGFFILTGFLLVPSLVIALCLFALGIISNTYLAGNLDFVGLILVLFSFGTSAPGVDDMLGVPFFNWFGLPKKWGIVGLRMLLGTAFMFLALYEKLLNPHLSEMVVQAFNLTSIVPVSSAMWVFSAGVIEFIIGLCLFVGFRTRIMSVIAFLVICVTFFFFKESVYSHVTLFGALSILFVTRGEEARPVPAGNEKPKKRSPVRKIARKRTKA